MITGFNTDVEHDGVVYHVQTEDKGLKSPLILSLVYVGGTILASKRTPYDDMITAGFDEKKLAERLNRQHKLICAAIHAGRIEDLKRQTGRDASARARTPEPAQEEARPSQPQPVEPAPPESMPPEPVWAAHVPAEPVSVAPVPPPVPTAVPPAAPPPMTLVSNAEDVPAPVRVEPEVPAYEDFAQVTYAPEHPEHVDYSRVLDYDGTAVREDELQVSLVDEKRFVAGEFVKIHVHVGHGREIMSDAAVTLKVLGSSFRPLIFSEKTGANGIATFYTMLPYFTSGRAAILVSATAKGHRAELRRVINQA